MAYKDTPRQDAYRLERVVGETVEGIAIFYTTAEANEVINHLDRRYRLMLGDRQYGLLTIAIVTMGLHFRTISMRAPSQSAGYIFQLAELLLPAQCYHHDPP